MNWRGFFQLGTGYFEHDFRKLNAFYSWTNDHLPFRPPNELVPCNHLHRYLRPFLNNPNNVLFLRKLDDELVLGMVGSLIEAFS